MRQVVNIAYAIQVAEMDPESRIEFEKDLPRDPSKPRSRGMSSLMGGMDATAKANTRRQPRARR